jgi:hypothetical protein
MERVTINIAEPDLQLVKQRAEAAGTSVSAYVAQAARDRALAEFFRAAAEAEARPSDEEMRRDAERIVAKHTTGRDGATGAAA